MEYDTSLHPKEAAWAQERITYAKEKNYRIIIVSHHQYYSAFWTKVHRNATLGTQVCNYLTKKSRNKLFAVA